MKIAIVSEWLDAWRGGAETSTLQFIHHLLDHDVELHVFTRSRPSPTPRMQVHTIGGAAMSRTRRSVSFMHRVDRLLKRQSYDIVHAVTPCLRADVYQPRGGTVAESIVRNLALRPPGIRRGLKRGANLLNLKQQLALRQERRVMLESGVVVAALSHYVVRQLQEHYHLPDQRIRLVFNGIDFPQRRDEERRKNRLAIRKEFGCSDRDCLVILIAHNFRLKGVARWMEALALLLSQGVTQVRSLVIGKGDSPSWHRRAHRMGLDRHLMFTGPSPRVPALRDAADILVHPTFYDPCSRVVLEALAGGLPCIASCWDGAAEIMEHGVHGFVLDDPWNTTALAELVRRLLDPALRESMSRAALVLGDRLSMARHTREMMALYEQLLAERTSTR